MFVKLKVLSSFRTQNSYLGAGFAGLLQGQLTIPSAVNPEWLLLLLSRATDGKRLQHPTKNLPTLFKTDSITISRKLPKIWVKHFSMDYSYLNLVSLIESSDILTTISALRAVPVEFQRVLWTLLNNRNSKIAGVKEFMKLLKDINQMEIPDDCPRPICGACQPNWMPYRESALKSV